MIGPVDPVEARRLARSIVEARREGRRMKPLTNTRLLSASDALAIQDAMIELRMGAGETLIGWAMIDDRQLAPVLSGSVVDDRIVKGIPSQAIDARVEPVFILDGEAVRIGLRAIDKVMGIDLGEDEIAHGHGLITLVMGDAISGSLALRWGREVRELPSSIDGMREKVAQLLAARGRSLAPTDLITTAALMPSIAIERGASIPVMVSTAERSIDLSLRQL